MFGTIESDAVVDNQFKVTDEGGDGSVLILLQSVINGLEIHRMFDDFRIQWNVERGPVNRNSESC